MPVPRRLCVSSGAIRLEPTSEKLATQSVRGACRTTDPRAMSIGFLVAMSGWLADVAAPEGNGRDEALTGIGLDDDTSVAEPSAPTPILTR